MASEQKHQAVLGRIDPQKREFIGKLVRTSAFVAPLVASFAMDSINTKAVAVINSNIIG